jgi:hypothetical protein
MLGKTGQFPGVTVVMIVVLFVGNVRLLFIATFGVRRCRASLNFRLVSDVGLDCFELVE